MSQKNMQPDHMVLTTFMLPAGYHRDAWRRPGSRAEELGNLDFVADLTQMAEEAKLDAVFFGDIVHANNLFRDDIMMNGFYEPISVLSALAARTSNIGLIGTMSTSFAEPYNAARQFAGLDHMSGGRAGWNIVTSKDGFSNFGGGEAPDPVQRYERATEFVDVVTRLWDSWADDAVMADRENGRWVDSARLRRIHHEGRYFTVEGPINMPRPPQGRPVLVQAGSSGPGMDLGSFVADVIYTAQPRKNLAQDFYARMRSLAESRGRKADSVKIIPGILPIIADTVAEAQGLADELAGLLDLDAGRRQIGGDLKIRLDDIGFDEQIPAERFSDDPAMGSRYQIFRRKSVEEGMTLRELIVDRARSTGHMWMVGTADQVAEVMIDWFTSEACDGFNLNSPFNPGGFEAICRKLVPALQERGYFRSEYEGSTLRENLKLDRPSTEWS
ncbi:NtaA/DmoA family FMN-dependent monooxygenase [Arthrobacter koreensis]|uniref:NtaA/DmoA family FMN-dependent monooxygenase n=1 Tax=Arthrobacter koreensis TaxID=199136 RepID=A0ABY6FRW2_9MICC|nr:NtaA/DmoA family FMN-dependent monooxygenase [Arthrobacter koreensis]UYB35850.1 NtaA/DmoA family FMN-dependent monooxygenase [Arthrobacter koreensis]